MKINNLCTFFAVISASLTLAACGPSPWEEARSTDTIEAFEAYIAANPDGEHVAAAQARIDALWDTKWAATSAANTREGYIEFVRSGASSERINAARDAILALQEDPAAAGGKVEMSGMFGSSGLIEYVDGVGTRYEGSIAGMPAKVAYAITTGTDDSGEQRFFDFDWTAREMTFGVPANVDGTIELQTPDGETVTYELFGLVPGPDNRATDSYLAGRGPDLLWSHVDGMSLAATADGDPPRELASGEAVLFAINEHFGLEYVP